MIHCFECHPNKRDTLKLVCVQPSDQADVFSVPFTMNSAYDFDHFQ